MGTTAAVRCASCKSRECYNGKDCLGLAREHQRLYEVEGIGHLHRAASAIEARHYCKEPRIREIMLFAHEMGYHKLGLAFCIGLAEEAEVAAEILKQEFDVISVCCKVSGIDKAELGLEHIDPERERETMCNPAGQASVLNASECELNILVGLCVGHDAVFSMISHAPVVTLIAKDRVLAHNPAGALYCPYLRRKLLSQQEHDEGR